MKKAIVLLSGGLDSTTVLAAVTNKGFDIIALSFNYGQRHNYEIECAKEIATSYNITKHQIANIDLGAIGGSALTDDIDVPKNRDSGEMNSEIPITYVPARNTIFLSYALALAEVENSFNIFIGVNALDYSGYPDCRPEYIESFQKMGRLATKSGVEEMEQLQIHTPLIDLKKSEIIMENVDGIFHQAAMASVQDSFRIPEKFHDVNVNGTENIFKIAKEFGIKVVYASSSSVYGDTSILPTTESDEKRPINPYAKTKLEKDKLAEQYAKNGLKVIGLRYFNVFGPRQSKEYAGVIKLFLERIQQGLPPLVNGDGLQIRDFVYVDDAVNANILSMESDIDFEFFNIGTGTTISILDLANIIIKFSGLKLKPIHQPAVPGDVKATQADITKAKMMLKWKPTTSIENWLKSTVLDIKNNL